MDGEEVDPLLGLFIDGLESSINARSSSVVLVAEGLGTSEGVLGTSEGVLRASGTSERGLGISTGSSTWLSVLLLLLFVLEVETTS